MNFSLILATPYAFLSLLLATGVIFVNGFTDAPNAISSAVSSGTLNIKIACFLSAVFNLLGVLFSSFLGFSVAKSISSIANFGKGCNIAVLSCFLTVIIFGLACWYFGMPSSESHAMIASIGGISLALNGYFKGREEFFKIIAFMIISCFVSYVVSLFVCKFIPENKNYKTGEIISCAFASFMHGVQDGQKFIALILFIFGTMDSSSSVFYAVIFVSFFMALGTSFGGKRIIKSMGEDILKLDTRRAFISDISSGVCMLAFSLLGFPVSTGNIKALSLLGVGKGEKEKIKKETVVKILTVSIITFPICFFIGYFLTLLFKSF